MQDTTRCSCMASPLYCDRGACGPDGAGGYYNGPLVVVENISEVFEKDTNY